MAKKVTETREPKKAKKPVRTKALPIEFDGDGKPRVVLDEPTKDKLRVALGICSQIVGAERGSPRATEANDVVIGLEQILGLSPANKETPDDAA